MPDSDTSRDLVVTARPGEPTPAEQCEHGETAWHEVVVRPNWEHRICPGPVTVSGVSPRSNEEIRADLAMSRRLGSLSRLARERLVADVEPLLARAVAAEARAEKAEGENADLRKRLGAATCPVSWASGTHSPPHQCSEPNHHLTRHRCACGVKG